MSTALESITKQRQKVQKLYLEARDIRLKAAEQEEVLKDMMKQYHNEVYNDTE